MDLEAWLKRYDDAKKRGRPEDIDDMAEVMSFVNQAGFRAGLNAAEQVAEGLKVGTDPSAWDLALSTLICELDIKDPNSHLSLLLRRKVSESEDGVMVKMVDD